MKVWCEEKGAEVLYIYLIFSDDFVSSLLYAFSDEIGFVANNKTNGHRLVTKGATGHAISDEFRH